MHRAIGYEPEAKLKKLAVAFHLSVLGWEGQTILPMSAEQDMLIEKTEYVVKKKDIPSFFTSTYKAQIRIWLEYREYGLAFLPKGSAYHPMVYMDIIRLLNEENAKRMSRGDT